MSVQSLIKEFSSEFDSACQKISLDDKAKKLEELISISTAPGFWDDNRKASDIMIQIGSLEDQVKPWQAVKTDLDDLNQLVELNDKTLEGDIENQLNSLQKKFEDLKKQLRFNGPYDNYDALMNIYAGAGGTDAQDWAQMLLRMYTRWAEAHNIKTVLLEESAGDEAGIKSASLQLSGAFVYGKLRGEHGVHRLVRLSPFNADAKRQTSFAKVEILPKIDAPDDVPIDESELKIDVFRAGGHGGQSVNTTDSAVRITHLPTGITVSIQNERSQLQNKETAMTILRSKLAQLKEEQHLETLADIKGPNQSAEWGNQIRSYVLHPYTMVKDLRTRHETTQAQAVLDGDLDQFIDTYLEQNLN